MEVGEFRWNHILISEHFYWFIKNSNKDSKEKWWKIRESFLCHLLRSEFTIFEDGNKNLLNHTLRGIHLTWKVSDRTSRDKLHTWCPKLPGKSRRHGFQIPPPLHLRKYPYWNHLITMYATPFSPVPSLHCTLFS